MSWFTRAAVHAIVLLSAAVCSAQVCQVRCGGGLSQGSAVCVGTFDESGDAVFLTAGHCCDEGRIDLAPAGAWMPGEIMAWAADGPGRDLGIVRLRGYRPKVTYRLGDASPAKGSEVVMAGYPEGREFRSTPARVVGHGKGYMVMSASGIKGVSGGPLLVGRTVVGIVTHNRIYDDQAEATNVETILATLKSWGLAPGKREQTGIHFGIGVQCGPHGCYRPAIPVYPQPVIPVQPVQPYYQPVQPVQPYYRPVDPFADTPQKPAYPGWSSPEPQQPAAPSPPAPNTDLADLRKRMDDSDARIEKSMSDLRAMIGALSVRSGEAGERGERGPVGPPGPSGPAGPAGRDADAAALSDLKSRLAALEAREIPVRIVDGDGKTVDERRYKLGETLEFRLVPKTK